MPQRSRITHSIAHEDEFRMYTEMYGVLSAAAAATTSQEFEAGKHIQFQSHVEIISIPSCASFDEKTKRNMWYSKEEFQQMRQHHNCLIAA